MPGPPPTRWPVRVLGGHTHREQHIPPDGAYPGQAGRERPHAGVLGVLARSERRVGGASAPRMSATPGVERRVGRSCGVRATARSRALSYLTPKEAEERLEDDPRRAARRRRGRAGRAEHGDAVRRPQRDGSPSVRARRA